MVDILRLQIMAGVVARGDWISRRAKIKAGGGALIRS